MIKLLKWACCLCFFVIAKSSFADTRYIALTIDDLPFVGDSQRFHLSKIIDALKQSEVPATGFVIAGKVRPDILPLLQKFKEAGLGLGNHTVSHANLNRTTTTAYLEEIDKADKILQPILSEPKYFRFPYLASGSGQKKEAISNYLSEKNYLIAPITIDSKDFMFNQLLLGVPEKARRDFLKVLKPCYLEFIRQQTKVAEQLGTKHKKGQILLIHANLLNAYVLPDIIALYQEDGYKFISLNDALTPIIEQKTQLAAAKPISVPVPEPAPLPKPIKKPKPITKMDKLEKEFNEAMLLAGLEDKLDLDNDDFIAWD